MSNGQDAIRGSGRTQNSTGPKSPEGEAVVSGNVGRGSDWLKLRQTIKALNQAMRQQRDGLEQRWEDMS